jgi:hypothetical protein
MSHFGLGYIFKQKAVTLSYTDSATSSSNGPTVTYSTRSLGTAAADRIILVGVIGNDNSRTVSSVTVGGVSASITVNTFTGASAAHCIYIWQAAVPSGTTGNIVVTFSGTVSDSGIGVWALYNANSTATATATNSSNPLSTTINVPANGALVGIARSGASSTFTWTNLTENYDTITPTNSVGWSGASATFATAQTSLAITATQTVSSTPKMSLAAFGPA